MTKKATMRMPELERMLWYDWFHIQCGTPLSTPGKSPEKVNGKRMTRNVYAHSEEECEEKLAEMIVQMKKEIAALRAQVKAG